MAEKVSSSTTRRKPPQATRFIVCRTPQAYWIASTKGGRVTGAFPVPTSLVALKHWPAGRAPRAR